MMWSNGLKTVSLFIFLWDLIQHIRSFCIWKIAFFKLVPVLFCFCQVLLQCLWHVCVKICLRSSKLFLHRTKYFYIVFVKYSFIIFFIIFAITIAIEWKLESSSSVSFLFLSMKSTQIVLHLEKLHV